MTGKAVAVEGCDQAGFEPLCSLFMSKASGFVVFQEEAEADAALMELDGHTVDTLVLTVRRPTATEEDLLGQMLRVKQLEKLVTLLRLSSAATGLANTLFALSKLQPRPPPLTAGVTQQTSATMAATAPTSTAAATTPTPAPSSVQTSSYTVPKLPYFSGSQDRKDNASLQLWPLEVRSLMQEGTYYAAALAQAVRQSLQGAASHMLLNFNQGASVNDILLRIEGT